MKKISIITPTYNELENIQPLVDRIAEVAKKETNYCFEHIFIDNSSEDGTVNEGGNSTVIPKSNVLKLKEIKL